MRIALLTDGIWPYRIGGMQKHSYYLVKYFARKGVEVDLYHLNDSQYDISQLSFFTDEEKKFIRSFVFEFPKKGKGPLHYIRESEEYSKILYEHFKKQSPVDFIYAKGYTGLHFLKKKRRGESSLPPIGIRLHGYEIYQPSKGFIDWYRKTLYGPLVKFLNEKADYIYSYGGGVTRVIKENIKNSENKIIEVPAGIEPEWLFGENSRTNETLRFVFLGRYDIRKGVKELSEALENLRGKNFEFHFIGPIPDEYKISAPNIIYHGLVSDAGTIKNLLRSSDILVLPSHSEGMPNVILEAMASGCAILATDVGAVNVMVDETNGWLIKPFSSRAIENKISEILQADRKIIERKKIASPQKVKRSFLWDEVIKKEIESIKKIIVS